MMGKKMCGVHRLALALIIVGAINWGLVGVADLNLVTTVFGNGWVTKLIYVLVGLSGLAMLTARRCCVGACKGPGNCQDGTCSSGGCCLPATESDKK